MGRKQNEMKTLIITIVFPSLFSGALLERRNEESLVRNVQWMKRKTVRVYTCMV